MSTINWGLVGCGDVARKRVAQAICAEPRSRLLAASRRSPEQLRQFCETFAVERSYTDAGELWADPDIDAVYIATPVHEHLPQTLAAARAGKHVLVEKPMAMTAAECDAMIAACRAAGVRLGIAYYRRFYPLVHRIQALIRTGTIGTPMAVAAVTSTSLPPHASEVAAAVVQEPCWRVIPSQGGGGALMDIGSHRLNLFLHLFGPARQVKACTAAMAADFEVDDTAVLLVQFESGVVGTLQCHFRSGPDPDELTIMGSHGRLVARPLNGDQLIIETGQDRRVEVHPPASNFNAPLIADFVSAVLDRREPTVNGEEGKLTNEVMERAYADGAPAGSC